MTGERSDDVPPGGVTCEGFEGKECLTNITPNGSRQVGCFFWETLTRGRVEAGERWRQVNEDEHG